jgi:hypothetical protein
MKTVEEFNGKINLNWTGSASELNSETAQKKVIQLHVSSENVRFPPGTWTRQTNNPMYTSINDRADGTFRYLGNLLKERFVAKHFLASCLAKYLLYNDLLLKCYGGHVHRQRK